MEAVAAAPCLPSPTKKAHYDSAAPAVPEVGLRGTFQRQSSTQWSEQLKVIAASKRAAVAAGHKTASSSSSSNFPQRRPLGVSRTEPVLGFAQTAHSLSGTYQTHGDILASAQQDVFNAAAVARELQRANEPRPMWETGSDTGSAFSRSASMLSQHDSGVFAGGAGTAAGNDGDTDGFDLDDVFGSSGSNLNLNFGSKRSFADTEEAAGAGMGEEDDEMAKTDVEDEEGGDQLGSFPAQRRIAAPRRGFSRTQSLPSRSAMFQPTAFTMDF
ncbi:hypothetical protein JCM8097_006017 [Rhodosporidiobolus ruineniae]